MHDAGAFAQNFNRTGFGTTAAKDVCVEDAQRGAAKVSGADPLDGTWNVDVGWAGSRTGCVKTVQPAIGFNDGRLRRERRLYVGKALSQQQIVRDACGTHEDLGKLAYSGPPSSLEYLAADSRKKRDE